MSRRSKGAAPSIGRAPRWRPPGTVDEMRVPIHSDLDILSARQKGRTLASEMGFSTGNLTLIATAISELARNIVLYARRGEIVLSRIEEDGRMGIAVTARDEGPGIPDIGLAMQSGYSTSGSLGLGLPGVRRLMDEFGIDSSPGKGTIVTAKKWRP
jgi:serine/threonine-protein kinase RsbT